MPVVGQKFLAMFVGWSDAILAGQILEDPKYLAAGIVASYLLWLVESLSDLVATGSLAIVARRVGERDRGAAERATWQSLILAAILGVLVGGATWCLAESATGWMQLEGDARALAAQYLRICALSGPPMMVLLVGITCLRAAGHTLEGMYILVAVNLANVGFSWLLTIGWGPIPALGWIGIAAGTSISFLVGGVLTWRWLAKGWAGLSLPSRLDPPDPSSVRAILRIGVPGAINSLAVVFAHLWFVGIIARLGTAATAAHGVAIRCESISWLTCEGFAVAAAALVGQSLGARRPCAARLHGWTALGLGVFATSLMGVVFFFFAPGLVRIFVRPEEVRVFEQGTPVLQLVAFAMPALAASVVLTGALRGAGDTRLPLVYNSCGLLLLRIPLAYLLTSEPFGLGLFGAWVAMVVDLQFRGLAAVYCFRFGGWTKIRV